MQREICEQNLFFSYVALGNMESHHCYEIFPVHESENPFLKNVDCTIILRMEESTREIDPALLNVTKTTYVQTNFKNTRCKQYGCKKCAFSSNIDLIHAYENACLFAEGFNSVLFLEDDAQLFRKNCTKLFRHVDQFLKDENFDIYSFGSFGLCSPFNAQDAHKKMIKLGFSQAIIWSKKVRTNLLKKIGQETINHIDTGFLSNFDAKYTFHKPIIVQTFPTTENMKQWCAYCDNTYIDKVITNSWIWFLQKCLKLDVKKQGWLQLYDINTRWHIYLGRVLGVCVMYQVVQNLVSSNFLKENRIHE